MQFAPLQMNDGTMPKMRSNERVNSACRPRPSRSSSIREFIETPQSGATPAFEEALTHAIRRYIEFPAAANREIALALNDGRSLHDLYGIALEKENSIQDEIENNLNRPTSEDDTHPSP